MNKLHICILLVLLTTSQLYAGIFGSLFGGPKVDFSKKLTDIEIAQSEIKTGINDVQTGINNASISLKDLIKVNADLKADIKTQLDLTAVKIDKSISTSAGRDVNITNDPMLLKYIIGGLLGIIMFMLRDNMANRKWLQNALKSKEEYKQKINGGGVK